MSDFSTGLCDCFSDCGVCIYVTCCIECAVADNWARSRREDCSLCHLIAFSHPVWTRDNIRMMLGQREKQYAGDCLVYTFCTPCAVCQDARELKNNRNGNNINYRNNNNNSPREQPLLADGDQPPPYQPGVVLQPQQIVQPMPPQPVFIAQPNFDPSAQYQQPPAGYAPPPPPMYPQPVYVAAPPPQE
ncbi:hypothetical protein TRFO_31736 [Tritrichomonas foetus]|uniref:Uncharacterized protein n=1 Tax=Tritrichomonas foetus TaxID=1144522 RepID=A0A1J4JSQ5_9EUKA|nr:hypothetical protein TRFO_31736 [Tritrichomonas foetus]|eukprot:OHT01464.1 hypothetical protein TRFO_31736 [Tritrichomonas foetus]